MSLAAPVIEPPEQGNEIKKLKEILYFQVEKEVKGGEGSSLHLLEEDGGDCVGAKKTLEELFNEGLLF